MSLPQTAANHPVLSAGVSLAALGLVLGPVAVALHLSHEADASPAVALPAPHTGRAAALDRLDARLRHPAVTRSRAVPRRGAPSDVAPTVVRAPDAARQVAAVPSRHAVRWTHSGTSEHRTGSLEPRHEDATRPATTSDSTADSTDSPDAVAPAPR